MSFTLAYSDEFFIAKGDNYDDSLPEPSEAPTTVLQALVSMHPDDWADYCRSVLGIEPTASGAFSEAMNKIKEVNSCTSVWRVPVEVWLEPEGYWSVLVYDSERI